MTTLDKIKAEIQKVLDAEGDSENAKAQAIALNWVLELFDKYAEQEPKWVPMTTRPMTEEEKEKYREQLEYVDDAVIFNCPLPDDGQEVFITVYGETELDTFYNDAIDGCYFENRDIENVTAWMPKPKPYEPQESDEISERNMKMWQDIFEEEKRRSE